MSSVRESFDLALLDMAERGERVRCSWPDLAPWFVSDDAEDRARAARRCSGCEVITLCGDSADEEGDVFTVRGGVDRRPGPRARAKGASA